MVHMVLLLQSFLLENTLPSSLDTGFFKYRTVSRCCKKDYLTTKN
jgi:hypothetical protein